MESIVSGGSSVSSEALAGTWTDVLIAAPTGTSPGTSTSSTTGTPPRRAAAGAFTEALLANKRRFQARNNGVVIMYTLTFFC